MTKNFQQWQRVKQHLEDEAIAPRFNQGEVWWCSVGLNIGREQDGKDVLFRRPVLILRKFSAEQFFGIPLTTKLKHHP